MARNMPIARQLVIDAGPIHDRGMAKSRGRTSGVGGDVRGPRVGAVAAVVLAGGSGRRMFPSSAAGGDKPLLRLGDRPLVAHVVERLRPQVFALAIAARGDAERFDGDPALSAVPVVDDPVQAPDGSGLGPLAGLLAGMAWARRAAPYCPLLLSAPADVPFLPRDLAARLAAHMQAIETDVLMVRAGGRVHPAIALWNTELLDDLRKAVLEEGVRKVEAFAARHAHASLDWPRGGADAFLNVNAPDDLARAEARLAPGPV